MAIALSVKVLLLRGRKAKIINLPKELLLKHYSARSFYSTSMLHNMSCADRTVDTAFVIEEWLCPKIYGVCDPLKGHRLQTKN